MDDLAPIVLFVYNRLWHTQQTVEALKRNDLAAESELYIYSDGAKGEKDKTNVLAVREYIKSITGFKSIHITEREKNYGLANSVIKGVTEVIEKYGKVIVLEDDIVTSPKFLEFMNNSLRFYQDEKKIFSISGYKFPIKIPDYYKHDVFIMYRSSSWGWATWKDRWEKVDWEVKDYMEFLRDKNAQSLFNRGGDDLTPMLINQMEGEIDSWAIRWAFAHFKDDAYCLFPVRSKIRNIGIDNTGTHSKPTRKFEVVLDNGKKQDILTKDLKIVDDIIRNMKEFSKPKLYKRLLLLIKYGI